MESDDFRRNFLRRVAEERGLDWTPGEESFADAREARLEKLGDLIAENVNKEALLRLLEGGVPEELPVFRLQASGRRPQQESSDGVFPVGEVTSVNGPKYLKAET